MTKDEMIDILMEKQLENRMLGYGVKNHVPNTMTKDDVMDMISQTRIDVLRRILANKIVFDNRSNLYSFCFTHFIFRLKHFIRDNAVYKKYVLEYFNARNHDSGSYEVVMEKHMNKLWSMMNDEEKRFFTLRYLTKQEGKSQKTYANGHRFLKQFYNMCEKNLNRYIKEMEHKWRQKAKALLERQGDCHSIGLLRY